MNQLLITLHSLDRGKVQQRTVDSVDALKKKDYFWANVIGATQEQIEQILGQYGVHHLIAEDVEQQLQRPKIEIHEKYTVILLAVLDYNAKRKMIHKGQIGIVLLQNTLLTFQNADHELFNHVLLHFAKKYYNQIDLLAHAVIDAIVDSYYEQIDKLGLQITELEEQILDQKGKAILTDLYNLKRDLIYLRRYIWPIRELISQFMRNENKLIHPHTLLYLRDVYDHAVEMNETIDTYRDLVTGLVESYMTEMSNRMNEIMKVLTIFSSVFIPLTFLAGIYGMNFKYFPELNYKYSYAIFWFVVIVSITFMIIFFKRKRWL